MSANSKKQPEADAYTFEGEDLDIFNGARHDAWLARNPCVVADMAEHGRQDSAEREAEFALTGFRP